jgi:hypothetical protein
MSSEAVPRSRSTLLWVVLTVVCALLVPGGGYVVALVSLHPRFRERSPHLALLLTVSTVVLMVQVVGLIGLPGDVGGVGPAERVG